eukprot:257990-Rhodomonas_salina.4
MESARCEVRSTNRSDEDSTCREPFDTSLFPNAKVFDPSSCRNSERLSPSHLLTVARSRLRRSQAVR